MPMLTCGKCTYSLSTSVQYLGEDRRSVNDFNCESCDINQRQTKLQKHIHSVLSKVDEDDFATFKKVQVHANNSIFL